MDEHPTVSVVTVCFNARRTLQRTIDSVLTQDYPAIEYVVVDGGSNDGTLDLIRQCEPRLGCWVSEPDRGIADAFNKGVSLSTGAFLTFVNADDWLSAGQIRAAMTTFVEHPEADFVFGDLVFYEEGVPIFRQVGGNDYRKWIRHGGMGALNHPTLVARRRVFDKVGGFDIRYRSAMDYEWLQRVDAAGLRGVYDERIVGNFSVGGESQARIFRNLAEVRRASIGNYGNAPEAWRRYLVGLAKATARLGLERGVSGKFARRVRFAINHHLRSLDAG